MKNILNLLFFLLVCPMGWAQAISQPITFELSLNGRKYDTMRLVCSFERNAPLKFQGTGTKNGTQWRFVVPDSIYEKSTSLLFDLPTGFDTLLHWVVIDKQGANCFLPKNRIVLLDYMKSDTVQKVSMIDGKDVILDIFKLCSDIDELTSINGIRFVGKDQRYVDSLKALVAKYPDSHGLMVELYTSVSFFDSREDLPSIYELFSPANKGSYFGKRLNRYIYNDYFSNEELLNPKTGIQQAIVTGKQPTLLIFSASWCAPCHKLVPTYKKIYADLGQKLELVYLTIDEQPTIEAWNKFVEKEQIPWRSVAASDQSNDIRTKYYVPYIPYSFVVLSDQSIVRIDLRKEEGIKRLYKLIVGD